MCVRYVGTSCAVQHLPCQRCAVRLWRHESSCTNCIKQGTPQLGQAAVARPWDVARSLVWPSAPPGRADVLAHGTVTARGPKIMMDLGYCTAQTTQCLMNAFPKGPAHAEPSANYDAFYLSIVLLYFFDLNVLQAWLKPFLHRIFLPLGLFHQGLYVARPRSARGGSSRTS